MIFSTALRHLREGARNIGRNGWMSFASISSIAVSLFILGVFMLLALNVEKLADQVDSQVQIRVYLQIDATEDKAREVERQIGRIPEVKKVTFVSKEEGLARLRDSLGEDGVEALEGYENENNPLPFSFDVEVFDPQTIDYAARQISVINESDPDQPIDTVKYGEEVVKKLFSITNAVRNIGLVIVAGLTVMAMFLISTTIKMTILARRREIGIMKLVGATNSFIRWPFFIEGALIGLIGSGVTAGVLMYGYSQLITTTQQDIGLYMFQLAAVGEVRNLVVGVIVGLGTMLGIWGSTLSVRKYLKV